MSLLDKHHAVVVKIVRDICRQELGDHLWRLFCHDIESDREHNPSKHSSEDLASFLLLASRTSMSQQNLKQLEEDRKRHFRRINSDCLYPNAKRFCRSANNVSDLWIIVGGEVLSDDFNQRLQRHCSLHDFSFHRVRLPTNQQVFTRELL